MFFTVVNGEQVTLDVLAAKKNSTQADSNVKDQP